MLYLILRHYTLTGISRGGGGGGGWVQEAEQQYRNQKQKQLLKAKGVGHSLPLNISSKFLRKWKQVYNDCLHSMASDLESL